MWGQRYPDAVYHLVTSTADVIEAIGGDELLYADGRSRGGAYVAMRTRATGELCFAAVGSMTDPEAAERLAAKYARGVDDPAMLAPATRYWQKVTRGLRITGRGPEVAALDDLFPWLAHNAMVHLSVPHGLEQYTGAAWGTRDVCQGPVEFLLASSTTSRSGRSCGSSSPSSSKRAATGRSGSCSSPMPRSATATATAT